MQISDPDKLLKLRTEAIIQKALKEFSGDMYIEPPQEAVTYGSYDNLNHMQISQGVVALVLATNLASGSVEDVDLYKLVRIYLWDEAARKAINEIIERRRLH